MRNNDPRHELDFTRLQRTCSRILSAFSRFACYSCGPSCQPLPNDLTLLAKVFKSLFMIVYLIKTKPN